MNTTDTRKRFDDSVVDAYLESHDVYESSDLGIDIAAVIQYAREHGIALSAVPLEVIEQYTKAPTQKAG
ncbi:MAG: hypothetical protein IK127_00420 [Clostridia bacterium]|nr:hypothetical protein [Clostridia bacterium]